MAISNYRFGDICKYDYNVYDKEQKVWSSKVGIGLVIATHENMVYVCEGSVIDKDSENKDENESKNKTNSNVVEEVKTEEQTDNKESENKENELDTLFLIDRDCSPLVAIDAFFDLCYSDNKICNEYLEYLWTINRRQEITAKIKLVNAYDAGMIFDQEVIKFIKSIETETRKIIEEIKMIKDEQETNQVVVSVQPNSNVVLPEYTETESVEGKQRVRQ